MGLTLSDIDKIIYREFRGRGYSHKETMKKFPKRDRKNVKKNIKKTFFQSHFGINI